MNADKFIVTLTADLFDGQGASKYRDIGLTIGTLARGVKPFASGLDLRKRVQFDLGLGFGWR
jgi:hypothetical protein